jgi:hypothetical protein
MARPSVMSVAGVFCGRKSVEIGVAENGRLVLSLRAVRGRGGSAGEPRQALIGATVVCPGLPRIPWQHFFAAVLWIAKRGGFASDSSNELIAILACRRGSASANPRFHRFWRFRRLSSHGCADPRPLRAVHQHRRAGGRPATAPACQRGRVVSRARRPGERRGAE